jgi:phosphatidylglycerophosphate synthase
VSARLLIVECGGQIARRPVLGLTPSERCRKAAERVGFSDQKVSRYVIVSDNLIAQKQWLTDAARTPLPAEQFAEAEGYAALVVETGREGELLAIVSSSSDFGHVRAKLLEGWTKRGVAIPSSGLFELKEESDREACEQWLLRSLIKDSEGFMSRHFDRKISLAISRRLAATSVTPDMMTLVSVAIGVFGALFFVAGTRLFDILGALCFLLHSIVDGCDGELARLKFQESRRGGMLDYWGDNSVHEAVFTAIAIGWWRRSHDIAPVAFGISAVVSSLASATFVYFRTMRRPHDGPLFLSVTNEPASGPLSRMADTLARRDFIYLAVALASIGAIHWFLIAAGIGSPLFLLVLFYLAFRENRGGGEP